MKEFIRELLAVWKVLWNLTPAWMKVFAIFNTVLLITAVIAGKVMWYAAYWLACTIIGGIWGYFFGRGRAQRIIDSLDAYFDTL